MSTTFHTPSFGDEDFDLPSLSMPPAEGSTNDGNMFPTATTPSSEAPVSKAMTPTPVVTSSAEYTGNHPNPVPSHHPTSMASHAATNSHNQMIATSLPMGHVQNYRGMHQQQAYQTMPHQQQPQNYMYPAHHNMDNSYANFLPKFPPQTFDIPDIQASLNGHEAQVPHHNNNNMHLVTTTTVMATSQATMLLEMPHGHHGNGMQPVPPPQGGQVMMTQMSPPGSTTTSPGRESSAEESSSDDSIPLAQLAQKRNAPPPTKPLAQAPPKKPRTPKKRKKKDPNEPQKPVSAYALFFRDTQAAIKTRNPNASFGEVSKIVASMWDGLDEEHKNDYKKRTEAAKKEYLKQLAAYRATLVSKGALENGGDGNSTGQKNPSPKNSQQQQQQQQQQQTQQQHHNNNNNSPSHMPNPASVAMTTTHHPMTSHNMAGGGGMRHPPPPHLSQIAHMNSGHMMPPQHYGMSPMMPPGGPMGPPPPPHMMAPPGGGMSPVGAQSPPEGIRMHDGYMSPQVHPGSPPMAMDSPATPMCVRSGCGNPAIHSPSWDNEYCSNDCVVSHCRDAFTRWVATRQGNHGNNTYASVK